MKKFRYSAFAALLLLSGSVALTSCDKKDNEVTILTPTAGNFAGAENCGGATSDYSVLVYNTADEKDKVWIENVYGIAPAAKASVSGNTITLPETPFIYKAGSTTFHLTVSGTGTVENDVLTFHFIIGGDFDDDCVFTGNRALVLPANGSHP